MARRRVRRRLLMPAAVVAACLVTLAGVRAWQLRRAQEELQMSRALQLASVSARSLDARIAETHTLLVSLGELLDPRASPAANDSVLQRIFRGAPVPYANLWIADTSGRAIGTARVPPAGRAAFAIRDRAYFREAVARRAFTVGDVVASRTIAGQPLVLTFALPVIDRTSGAITAVVGASIQVDSLDAVRTVRAMREGTVLTIIDSSGTVVFRSLDAGNWIGRRFAIDSGDVNDFAVGEGVGAGMSADGIFRLTGFRTTRLAPWALYIGIPARYTLDVVRNQFIRDVAVGSLITLIILGFGYRSTLKVVGPIESLTADARAIAAGDMARRSAVGSDDEIGDLARAFNRMADTVAERNAALQASQEQLLHVQKMDALGSFAGGIAHDFNNYLASIVAHAELADLSLDGEEGARADIQEVLASAGRAADLTRQILVFSRKQVVERRELDLNSVVHGIERMLVRLVGEDRTLTIHYADDEVVVNADHGQLEQVVVNLVANARDAMPDGGTVALTIDQTVRAAAAGSDARVPAAGTDRLARLSVRDHGVGIPAEMLDRIFDPFFSTKARGRGTGMGLAIAYSIVEQSGGTLTAESTVGVGTVFTLLLPLRDGHVAPSATRAPADKRTPGSGRILLTEDDESVRQSTQRMLTQAGYTVISAPNGPVALERFEQAVEPFDLLLSDVVMPGMSGSELARRLRERQPDLAVLYMSGYADDEHLHDTLASSDAVCIAKPFTMQTLLDATRAALVPRTDAGPDVTAAT
jgi:signal transduction histidine kinase/CheY-like chemotaxis protein